MHNQHVATGGSAGQPDATLEERALVATGDGARLTHVLARARRGGPVTVGVIGGSITQGAITSAESRNYASLVAEWWRRTFPTAAVDLVNAGIGATGSDYGALRVQRDLLSRKPDFVVVEYAVNDGNSRGSAETLEGLVRQVLKQGNRPAVVLLFMMHQNGANAQEWFIKVGRHYGLPMISYRDALWPEIEAGRMVWSDISPDVVHPNDRGHAYAAGMVTHLLKRAFDAQAVAVTPQAIPPLPAPLFHDRFEFTDLREAAALNAVANDGWIYDPGSRSWRTATPGASIEFEISGRVLLASHYVTKGPMGRARVVVDGGAPQTLEGWFDQTWGGYRQTNIIGKDLSPGPHRIVVELLPDTSEGSTGHEFRILGLGAAGVAGAHGQ